MKQRMLALLGAVAVAGSMAATAAFAQNLPKTNVNVIGNISITTQFKQIEKPYWTELLNKSSNGAIVANFKGWDEMSLKGPEVFRLVQRGVAVRHRPAWPCVGRCPDQRRDRPVRPVADTR